MADTGWLRFLGPNRARQHGLVSRRSEAALQDLLQGASGRAETAAHREKKSMTRLTSQQGTSLVDQEATLACDSEYTLDEVDRLFINAGQPVWHNPSVDQVAEALRVAVMTNPANEPLSPEYRPHILLLCEAYGTRHNKVANLESQLAEAKEALKQESNRYSSMEEHCMVQDARYKAEAKRLEMFIHKMSNKGMEAVALARAGSLLKSRTGATTRGRTATERDAVGKNKSTHKTTQDDEDIEVPLKSLIRQDTVLSRTRTIDTSNEIRLSRGFRNVDNLNKAASGTRRFEARAVDCGKTLHDHGREEQHPRRASVPSIGPDICGTGNIPPHEGSVERKRDSTEESTIMQGVGIVDHPNSASTTHTHKQDTVTEHISDGKSRRDYARHRRQFSFVPGDDRTAVWLGGTRPPGNAPDTQRQTSQAPSSANWEENRRSRSAEWVRTMERPRRDMDETPGATDLAHDKTSQQPSRCSHIGSGVG